MTAADPDRWTRVCAIFEAARGLHGEARDALLAASGDVADEVRELLAHHETEGAVLGGDAAPGAGPRVGEEIGPYRLEEHLGSGGMATVFRATGPEGDVALKLLHPEMRREPVVVERFRREAALGRGIRHPNVVRTLGMHADDCLVLAFVPGAPLRRVLEAEGALDEGRACALGDGILAALEAIHAHGAVHRDLKPSNVMVRPDGSVVVTDLGIALPLDDLLRLSRTGQFVGTVRHAAPEQLTHDKAAVDARTDLYALGLLLYETLSGTHPVPPGGFVSTMRAQLERPAPPLRDTAPELTPALAELVMALLHKAPGDRPSSATEVRARLRALRRG